MNYYYLLGLDFRLISTGYLMTLKGTEVKRRVSTFARHFSAKEFSRYELITGYPVKPW